MVRLLCAIFRVKVDLGGKKKLHFKVKCSEIYLLVEMLM